MLSRIMASTFRYLDLTVDEQLLHRLPVPLMQTGVMHPDPEGQRQLQIGISHSGDDVLDLETHQNTHQHLFGQVKTQPDVQVAPTTNTQLCAHAYYRQKLWFN